MRVVVGGRQAGKTHRLVEWVREGQRIEQWPGYSRVLLAIDVREALRLRDEYNLDPRQITSVEDWRTRAGHVLDHQVEVAIDNLDIWLENMLRQRIAVVSATGTMIGADPLLAWSET